MYNIYTVPVVDGPAPSSFTLSPSTVVAFPVSSFFVVVGSAFPPLFIPSAAPTALNAGNI